MIRQLVALVAVAALAAACAVGNRHDDRTGSAGVPETGDARIAVAVTDLRGYVPSGYVPSGYVPSGLTRAGAAC